MTDLKVAWSGEHYAKLGAKRAYTVWRPSHFVAELAELVAKVERDRRAARDLVPRCRT